MWKKIWFWYSVYSHAYINNQAYSMNTKDWYWHCRVRTNQTSFTNRFIKSIILVNQTRARRARTNKLERGKWTRLLSVNGITSSYHLLPMHCLKHTEHGGWKSKKKSKAKFFFWCEYFFGSLRSHELEMRLFVEIIDHCAQLLWRTKECPTQSDKSFEISPLLDIWVHLIFWP